MEEKLVDRLAAAPVKKQEKMGPKQEKQGNRETGKQEKVGSRVMVGLSHCGTLMDEMQNWKIGKIK